MKKTEQLSRAATARRLKIDAKTLDRWRDRGCPQNADGSFDPAKVRRWQASQKSPSAAGAQRGQIVLIRARCKDLERRIIKIFREHFPTEMVIAQSAELVERGRAFIARRMGAPGVHGFFHVDQAQATLDELESWTDELRLRNEPIISFTESIQPIADSFDDIKAARETLAEMRARYLLIRANIRASALIPVREFEEHTGLAAKRFRNAALSFAGWPSDRQASDAMWDQLLVEVFNPIAAATEPLDSTHENTTDQE